jgi:hypothetical protein
MMSHLPLVLGHPSTKKKILYLMGIKVWVWIMATQNQHRENLDAPLP